jgi:hypothetical protein
MRTLLLAVAVLAVTGGGARWWHDQRMAKYDSQKKVCIELADVRITALWSYEGPRWLNAWKILDGPLFRQPTHVYCDNAADDAVAENALRIGQLNVETLTILGRQIVPHARAVEQGESSRLIDVVRAHPTLKHLVVDASIRGTPLEFDAPTYTVRDRELLEELLPGVEIQWIEVN